ncbi:uncharacterized protein TOT_030000205 [Theileria orientalis strain Shintoku]|uniref:Protein RER1 n=1 Tax=Theileria orientalis strain Shintoku TaxID=869250 RepID=J4DPM1_THEOR|nr:uncharacterized protein TOT_030000205 [Theileria orientalis strain Shintoku]PVC51483.1 hypothetical protein MACL_00001522 [Theileria orientalis]BAM40944.1 uncharacterized protein TOT_030000205 [Theileria orientalis strain Shintoku]|eukprot:XP_009691245.1 uncharacterized protein TOT_030000205 [Theileria orientalis strain Shintoku]
MGAFDPFRRSFHKCALLHRAFLDYTVKFIYVRWTYFSFLFFLFWTYVIFNSSHYVIAYMYTVYLLSLVMRFLTPLSFKDLCTAHEGANSGTILPLSEQDAANSSKITKVGFRSAENVYEFKPFLRQLNEFTFWLCAVRVSYIALLCLFSDFLDIDVYWPLLVFYFICLFTVSFNEQIQNMIKYKYVPFNFSKRSYGFKIGK